MPLLRNKLLAGTAIAAVACLPSAPAAAACPLLFAPWALGHIVAPLIIGAVTALQPAPYYPAGAGYYGGGGYPVAPGYGQQRPYYAPSQPFYPRGYYGPSPYASTGPRPYSLQRGVYAAGLPYHGRYGGQQAYRSSGFGRQRR